MKEVAIKRRSFSMSFSLSFGSVILYALGVLLASFLIGGVAAIIFSMVVLQEDEPYMIGFNSFIATFAVWCILMVCASSTQQITNITSLVRTEEDVIKALDTAKESEVVFVGGNTNEYIEYDVVNTVSVLFGIFTFIDTSEHVGYITTNKILELTMLSSGTDDYKYRYNELMEDEKVKAMRNSVVTENPAGSELKAKTKEEIAVEEISKQIIETEAEEKSQEINNTPDYVGIDVQLYFKISVAFILFVAGGFGFLLIPDWRKERALTALRESQEEEKVSLERFSDTQIKELEAKYK